MRADLTRNKLFHFCLYARANSPLMLELIESLWARVGPFLNSLFEISHYLPHANEHHRRIVAAVRQHSGASVRRALVRDIEAAAAAPMRKLCNRSDAPS